MNESAELSSQRIDLWLDVVCLYKTRSQAQTACKAGKVEVNGQSAKAHRALREGDAVTFLDVHRTCNACWYCLVARASTRCPSRKVYGITYGLSDGLTGGWAQQIHLKQGTRCLRLDGVDPERGGNNGRGKRPEQATDQTGAQIG